jgi:ABC-2 type transport system permease protein
VRGFLILWLKEEKALFSSPIAYVLITVFLLIMGYSFTLALFVSHLTTLVHMFFQMFVLFLLTVPIMTMRLIAEERKLGTLEVLLTSPATEAQIVLAKFAASMSLIALMLALSAAYAIVLGVYGNPDWGPIFSGYLGLMLLAAALIAFGLLTSALTDNQIIAALLSLSVFLLLWIIDEYGYLLPNPFDTLVVNLSLSVHFNSFATGSRGVDGARYRNVAYALMVSSPGPRRSRAYPGRARRVAALGRKGFEHPVLCGVVRRHPAAVRVRAAVAAADPGFAVPRDAFQHCACGRRHRHCLPGECRDLPP